MDFVKQSFAHVTSTTIMTSLVACAYITEAKNYIQSSVRPGNATEGNTTSDSPANVMIPVTEYAELYGFKTERYYVETKDGFLLPIDRIYSSNVKTCIHYLRLPVMSIIFTYIHYL